MVQKMINQNYMGVLLRVQIYLVNALQLITINTLRKYILVYYFLQMQSSNLYFVYNSGSEQFWKRKDYQLINDLMQGLLQDSREMITMYKTGTILKKLIARQYKTFQQHLFYFRDNGELGGFVVLKNVYFKLTKKNVTPNIPYDSCLTLIRDHSRIDLYFNHSVEIDLFLKELQKCCIIDGFEQQYLLLQNIGTGSTAQVFLAENILDHTFYAVKQIEKEQATGRHRVLRSKTLLEEIFMMRSLDHPNIMRLHQVYESEKHIRLVISLFEGGQLIDKIKNFNFLIKRELVKLLIETVHYMHTKGIMHRDLKPFNILYKSKDPLDWQFGIGDFGFSTSIKQQQHILYKCGTPGYVAPEIIEYREKAKMYGQSCDVFSIGVIIYEIFFNSHPFKSKTKDDTLRQNVNAQINFDDNVCIPQSLKSLIISMVRKNPRHRFTLQQCLDHDFFKESLSKFNELSQEIQDHEPKTMEIRNIRCQTLQLLKTQNNKRRQSLPQDISVTQEPQIQQRKSILIKHRQSVSSTHESKLKLESQQQFQLSQQNRINFASQLKITKLEKICQIFLNDQHYIPKEFGNIYLIKKY
ncbi:unnamed protein product [Paramecium octaurelia]|uniref:Protein kinase domain-containing protein n=1 Tax=Paramecium octaurelia TaxID=43137 RepID=A0A8S1YBH8_PAROT|nr:unnamed protein product [Paramecium octaurelia]